MEKLIVEKKNLDSTDALFSKFALFTGEIPEEVLKQFEHPVQVLDAEIIEQAKIYKALTETFHSADINVF